MTKREISLAHEFVEYIPADIQDGKIYISIPYATAAHKCCCGCGNEVVTPLSPTDWKLIFDGQSISLDPSIGNWSFACKSHYWIKNSRVVWARMWSNEQIQRGRAYDRSSKDHFYNKTEQDLPTARKEENHKKPSFWSKLKKILKI